MSTTRTKTSNRANADPTLIGRYSRVARDSNAEGGQNGRQASGMYPQVSRTKLAEVTGKDITTISQIMRGRNRPKFDTALKIAHVVGVSPEEFCRHWQRQREKFLERQGRERGGGGGREA
jgi:DNA-binding XRE family transcriptional regulator